MSGWKAGPEKPRTPYCWDCSRRFHGRVHATIIGGDGRLHDVHKTCVNGRPVVGGSTTMKSVMRYEKALRKIAAIKKATGAGQYAINMADKIARDALGRRKYASQG